MVVACGGSSTAPIPPTEPDGTGHEPEMERISRGSQIRSASGRKWAHLTLSQLLQIRCDPAVTSVMEELANLADVKFSSKEVRQKGKKQDDFKSKLSGIRRRIVTTRIVWVGCCLVRSCGSSEALVLPDLQHARTDGGEIVSGIERAPFDRLATTVSTLSASTSVMSAGGALGLPAAGRSAVGGRRLAIDGGGGGGGAGDGRRGGSCLGLWFVVELFS